MKNENVWFGIASIIFFVVVSFFVFPTVFAGKEAYQPDIVNYKGGINEVKQHRELFKEESYWSNSMFGGMPTYQSGAIYENDWIKKVDQLLRLNLPRPADYLFLCLVGFFILGITFFRNWKYALLGAVFFAFSTYFFILVAAGHNSKLHSIAYFAPLVAGVILLYRKKHVLGFFIYTLFLALEVMANHIQMTYYLFLSLIFYFFFQFYYSFKNKQFKPFILATSLLVLGGIIALGINANRLLPTYELSKESIRSKPATIQVQGGNSNKKGLDKEYITNWSYGKIETFNLFIPHFTGGGDGEKIELKNTRQAIVDNVPKEELEAYSSVLPQLSAYWGDQPMTFGPAYQGAVVIFLALLALFLVNNRYKWWLFSATLLSFLLAWGKNFMPLTDFFIDYFPLYNKFRTVSSILVIAEFTIPFLAIMGVYAFFENKDLADKTKQKYLIAVTSAVSLFLLIFYFFGEVLFSFQTQANLELPEFLLKGLKQDRIDLFKSDVLRTLLLVVFSAAGLFFYQFKLIKSKEIVLAMLLVLSFYDLNTINKKYLNDESFIDKRLNQSPFLTEYTDSLIEEAQQNKSVYQIVSKVEINKELKKIKDYDQSNYRVLNLIISPFNEANTSYFHQSVGGYHGAKLRIYQDVIDTYFTKGLPENMLSLLNVKYFVMEGKDNKISTSLNSNINGNAWFVEKIRKVKEGKEALLSLEKLDNRKEAVYVGENKLKTETFSAINASIKLIDYKPNKLIYSIQAPTNQYAVFSEIYYPHGWKAYVDGKETPIIKTDFFLRGIEVPANTKKILLEFKPQSVAYGIKISMAFSILFVILVLGGVYNQFKRKSIA